MNIHHLELFYYVAGHGGISEAVRHMPYGIQQPAVSDQVIQLEESLGVTLFHRRPFSLTPAGKELYESIKPFFDSLTPMADKLRGGVSQHLRIAASEIVLRDYLPGVLQELRKQFPRLRVTLREGYDPEVILWLERQEIDVAIGFLGSKPPTGIHALPLTRLRLILLVPRSSRLKSADELWQRDRIEEALITVPSNEPMCRAFQEGLRKLKVDWFSGIEVSTIEMVQTYVANGYGIGVTVGIPKAKYHPQVRVLPLEGFPTPVFGVLWQGRPAPVVNGLLDIVRQTTVELLRDEDPALLLPGSQPALAGQGGGASSPGHAREASPAPHAQGRMKNEEYRAIFHTMRWIAPAVLGLFLTCAWPALLAVEPIPESEQPARAMKILDAYHGARPETLPKKLHLVYFTPADREPAARYEQRLEGIIAFAKGPA